MISGLFSQIIIRYQCNEIDPQYSLFKWFKLIIFSVTVLSTPGVTSERTTTSTPYLPLLTKQMIFLAKKTNPNKVLMKATNLMAVIQTRLIIFLIKRNNLLGSQILLNSHVLLNQIYNMISGAIWILLHPETSINVQIAQIGGMTFLNIN